MKTELTDAECDDIFESSADCSVRGLIRNAYFAGYQAGEKAGYEAMMPRGPSPFLSGLKGTFIIDEFLIQESSNKAVRTEE